MKTFRMLDDVVHDAAPAPSRESLLRHYWRYLMRIDYASTVTMAECGFLSLEDAALSLNALRGIEREADEGAIPDEGAGDFVDEALERLARKAGAPLTDRLKAFRIGLDVDHTMFRMALKDRLAVLTDALFDAASLVLAVARCDEAAFSAAIPHEASPEPIAWRPYLFGLFDMLMRDGDRMTLAMRQIDRSPMGTVAAPHAEIANPRERMAELLGFERLQDNVIDGVLAIDGYLAVQSALQTMALALNRLGADFMRNPPWTDRLGDRAEAIQDLQSQSALAARKAAKVIVVIAEAAVSTGTIRPDAAAQIAGLEAFEPGLRAVRRFTALIQPTGGENGIETASPNGLLSTTAQKDSFTLTQDQADIVEANRREAGLASLRRHTGAVINRMRWADQTLAAAVDGLIAEPGTTGKR